MVEYSIYVVDDEESVRDGISMVLGEDYRVETFPIAEAAIDAMSETTPDLILLDIGLPGMSGIDALREIKKSHPDMQIIIITAYEDIDTVIAAMKLGAYDYVVKPLYMRGLKVTIQNALETIKLRKEVQAIQEKYIEDNIPCFIRESKSIQSVMELIEMVAKSPDTPILITGETGTGKELIASAIHYRSPRFRGPLITVNCAAIPADLVESELFGYEKGAFTGAVESGKKGLIEEAEDGTLFLDEVGDLSTAAQAKLLRFLDEGQFYRVGGTKKLSVKTRVISATNRDLGTMVKKGRFRRDLFYRLAVVEVAIPSLNQRREDIVPLARHFLLEFNEKFGKKFSSISPEAEKALIQHDWIGNIRELRNVLERGVLTGSGRELTPGALGLVKSDTGETTRKKKEKAGYPPIPPGGVDLTSAMEEFEKFYMAEALKRAGGRETEAAKFLKMNYSTFRYRRRKLGVE